MRKLTRYIYKENGNETAQLFVDEKNSVAFVYTPPTWRRKGHAYALIEKAKAEHTELSARVAFNNDASNALFKKAGFSLASTEAERREYRYKWKKEVETNEK